MTQNLLNQAVALQQAGQLAQAEALYRQGIAATPANFHFQYRLALLLFQQQRNAEALAAVTAALAFNPDVPEGLMLQGALLVAADRRKEALTRFDRVLLQKPDSPGALFNRALVLVEMGQFADAVTAFDLFLARTPDSAEAWSNRGAALQQMGKTDDALASYDRAIEWKPGRVQGWLNRGTVLLSLGRFKEAVESFDKVLALDSRHHTAWLGRGRALLALEDFAESRKSVETSLRLVPNQTEAIKQLDLLLETQKIFEGVPSGPQAADIWYQRAAVLHVNQRFEEALAALDKALAAQPGFPDALAFKGTVLFESRRVAEGLEAYRYHAETVYGAEPVETEKDPPHKQRHDSEQRAYMAANGIHTNGFHLEAGARVPGPAVNPVNAEDVARRWGESSPQIVVIDNLLTPEALEGLRRFCWGSTVWRKPYANGYLGAMPEQGFACPLLAQIADELRDVFPTVIGNHGLRRTWGFKYDSSLTGIANHADQAAVNVNFWIAPEDANLDPKSGGLIVWDIKAPLDWDFKRYNVDVDGIRDFLEKTGAKPITVPHRTNRAVIFDSDLFHKTDRLQFREGYLNRRINVTMLYGRRVFFGA